MKDRLEPVAGIAPTRTGIDVGGNVGVGFNHRTNVVGVLPPAGTGPKHLNGPGNKVDLGNKGLFTLFLVLEVGGGGSDYRRLPVKDIGERVNVIIMSPGGGDACDEARGVGYPLWGVEIPALGGDVTDKEEPNRDMIGDEMGGEGPGGARSKLEPAEFLEGISPRG